MGSNANLPFPLPFFYYTFPSYSFPLLPFSVPSLCLLFLSPLLTSQSYLLSYSVPVQLAPRTASSPTPSTWHYSPAERYARPHPALYCTTSSYTALHCAALHYTILRCNTLFCTITIDVIISIMPHISLPPQHSTSSLSLTHHIAQARAIIKAEPPFAIMHVNEPWTAMSGLTQAEADGLPLGSALRLHTTQVTMLLFV